MDTWHLVGQFWGGFGPIPDFGVGGFDHGAGEFILSAYAAGSGIAIDDSLNVALINVYTASTPVGGGFEVQGVFGNTSYEDIFAAYDQSLVTFIGGSVRVPKSPLSAGGDVLIDTAGNFAGFEYAAGIGVTTQIVVQAGAQKTGIVASFNIIDDVVLPIWELLRPRAGHPSNSRSSRRDVCGQ